MSVKKSILKITGNINKLMKYMNLGNKSSLEFETCLPKLQKYIHKIKTVLDSLIQLTNDPISYRTFQIFMRNKIFESFKLVNSI